MARTVIAFAAIGAVLASPAAIAQTPSPEIQKIIDDSAAAYRDMKAFSTTLDMAQGPIKLNSHLTVTRDGKLAAVINTGQEKRHVVADGASIYSDTSRDTKKYVKQPETKLDDAVTVLARSGGAGVGLLPILLTSPTAEKQMIPGKPSSVKKGADATLDGVSCDVIAAIIGEGERKAKYEFSFGKQDHFLRRIAIGPENGAPTVSENYTGVTTTVNAPPTLFKYTPAAGAVAVDPPKAPAMFDPRLKTGASPFALVGKDLSGKSVSLDEYKGKVLMLDFWATWCGPCVGELPNVIEAYKKYHAKGFEIVGISLDRAEDRAKLQTFITDNGMAWRQVYDGKYWQAANAMNYGVQAIPFTLLIGRNGKIAAVGARGEALAPAIEAALKQQ